MLNSSKSSACLPDSTRDKTDYLYTCICACPLCIREERPWAQTDRWPTRSLHHPSHATTIHKVPSEGNVLALVGGGVSAAIPY